MSEVPVLQVDGLVKHFPVSRGIILPQGRSGWCAPSTT